MRRWRLVTLTAAVMLTAGCGGDDANVAQYGAGDPIACPTVSIVRDAAEVVQFRPGPGRDLTDVVARGAIADFSGTCDYSDDGAIVDLDLVIIAERGPAAGGDQAQFEYFVAVADPNRTVLAKEQFRTGVTFEEGRDRGIAAEELEQIIPMSRTGLGQDYQILVGFQLTPEQLEFNRR
jgi:hypothetical protein